MLVVGVALALSPALLGLMGNSSFAQHVPLDLPAWVDLVPASGTPSPAGGTPTVQDADR